MREDILKIKECLKQRKITYSQLAEMSGVPLNTLKNIFGGFTPNPRIDTINAIETALGLDKTRKAEDKYEKALVSLDREGFCNLSEKDQQYVVNIFNMMVDMISRKN